VNMELMRRRPSLGEQKLSCLRRLTTLYSTYLF
jgi:hypothetical protein